MIRARQYFLSHWLSRCSKQRTSLRTSCYSPPTSLSVARSHENRTDSDLLPRRDREQVIDSVNARPLRSVMLPLCQGLYGPFLGLNKHLTIKWKRKSGDLVKVCLSVFCSSRVTFDNAWVKHGRNNPHNTPAFTPRLPIESCTCSACRPYNSAPCSSRD